MLHKKYPFVSMRYYGFRDDWEQLLYDLYIHTQIGYDFAGQIAREMGGVLGIAAVVIAVILLFTSRSYFEVVIFFIVFFFAALFNMGTNFWLGEISSIANSIAIILQLALAIDYSIIFSHRYQDEALVNPSTRAALEKSLAESILEISSSSLTTISGLGSLLLMQFRLGWDREWFCPRESCSACCRCFC